MKTKSSHWIYGSVVTFFLILSYFVLLSCKKEVLTQRNDKKILSFSFVEQLDSALIDETQKKITITVKYDADISKLVPLISVSPKAKVYPDSGAVVDFSHGFVEFTVTAEDHSTEIWKVYVVVAPESEKNIVSFFINDKTKVEIYDSVIKFYISKLYDLSTLKPHVVVSEGATISPASDTVVDFSERNVIYVVTGADGSQKIYKIRIIQLEPDTKITNVSIPNQIGATLVNGNTYIVEMASGADFNNLVPTIETSEGTTISPASGIAVDFSDGSVEYTVSLSNGKSEKWNIVATYPLFKSNNSKIQFTGRIDFSNPEKPKYSAPGVYVEAKFKGSICDIELGDEHKYGSYFNFIEVVIDNQEPVRIQLEDNKSIYRVAKGLANAEHTIRIYKDTESGIGYLVFSGFRCAELLDLPARPSRKIECYGNSITCGYGTLNALCDIAVDSKWYYSNQAYMSYGAIAARDLNAQFHLSAYSGIGLVKSCCNITETMPDMYDRIFFNEVSSVKWNFSKYIPDVVTINLGQNDGIMDSTTFCVKYVNFVKSIRLHYPNASIFLLTSPMADDALYAFQQKCLSGIANNLNTLGDSKVYKVFLTNKLNNGCISHPDGEQQLLIASELEAVIKDKMGW